MIIAAIGLGIILVLLLLSGLAYRTVVPPNTVHIVQTAKKTTSYGTGQKAGNSYYRWPSWVPGLGVMTSILPVNNFNLMLHGYNAYDKDRVPFELDLTAFFRIIDTNRAAERVATFKDLEDQLLLITQGAARKVLASYDINAIMVDRSTFGEHFTNEVKAELTNWGVEPVKNMELMDIRDIPQSSVIQNIMAKKVSHIEMESRTEVAKNKQVAKTAEIEAEQTVQMRDQEAKQAVGERAAQRESAVGIATEQAQQAIKGQANITKQREMDVLQTQQVRQAEIERSAAVVQADAKKQTTIIVAEANRQTTIIAAEAGKQTTIINADAGKAAQVLQAEGQQQAVELNAAATLVQSLKSAEGIQAIGLAKAEAEKALQLAPVAAQITLAKEIGENEGYQHYLIAVKGIEANAQVGTAQAQALAKADVKIIAQGGSAAEGASGAGGIFTPQGGFNIATALAGLATSKQGQELVDRLSGGKDKTPKAA